MALSRNFTIVDKNDEIMKDLWDNMVSHYNYVGSSKGFIKYPHKEFMMQGIPTPWQTRAWIELIREIGEENFCSLPLRLNDTEKPEVLFETEFMDRFGKLTKLGGFEITFSCGYFWRFNDCRRDKMLNFVVDNLLKKGAKVIIWTQDETLKKALGEKCKERLDNSARNMLRVHCVSERIDVHYTLIKDNNNWENSLLLMELPHTEAHDFRLETYLTFKKLESFGCKPEKFIGILNSFITYWKRPHLSKRFRSWRNKAPCMG
jgi:hypothetical protein